MEMMDIHKNTGVLPIYFVKNVTPPRQDFSLPIWGHIQVPQSDHIGLQDRKLGQTGQY